MEDKRGENYSSGNCLVTGRSCNYYLEGACGICNIGKDYKVMADRIERLVTDLLLVGSLKL